MSPLSKFGQCKYQTSKTNRVFFYLVNCIQYMSYSTFVVSSYRRSVCLFVSGFSSHSKIFQTFIDVTITGEGLQILTYTRHSWLLSSKGSFTFSHILLHGPTHYNGHLLGLVPLRLVAERLELLVPVLTTQICTDRETNPDLPQYMYLEGNG